MKNAILVTLLSILIFLGCTKEKIIEIPVPVDKQYRWKLDSNFLYDNSIISNSFATENELYLYGKYFSVLTYDKNSKQNVINYRLRGEPNNNFKMPISTSYFVNIYQNTTYFISTKYPVLEYGHSTYKFGYINPNLATNLALPFYELGQCMAINNKNQVLIPYTTFDPSRDVNIGSNYTFLMADVSDKSNGEAIRIEKTKTVSVDNGGYPLNNLFSNKDYFIASLKTNYKISSDGKVKCIASNYFFKKVFQRGDTLYAVSDDGNLLRSTNDADDWNSVGKLPFSFTNSHYYLINNEVIGTYFSQLFHFQINGKSGRAHV